MSFAKSRAGTNSGICIGIGANTSIFDGIGIGQVCYTSTSFVVCPLLTKVIKLK